MSAKTLSPKTNVKPTTSKKPLLSTISYYMLNVTDMAKAVEFYKNTLGLAAGFESPEWTELNAGIKFALHLSTGSCASSSSSCGTDQAKAQDTSKSATTMAKWTGIVFGVENVTESYNNFKAAGVKLLGEPKTVCEDGRSFEFEDPFGNVLSAYGK